MNYLKNIIPIGLFLLLANFVNAQVKFKLILLGDGRTYQVSAIPEVSFQVPLNVTSTGQVTLKAPNRGLAVDQIFNLVPGVVWEPNSLTESPEEAPEFDYISFGLITQATDKIIYEAGVEIPLFAFTNFYDCIGDVSLIDNETDPFSPPNSMQVNVGNQITILGAQGDAYMGNAESHTVSCDGTNTTSIEQIDPTNINMNLFPNPAADYVLLDFIWDRSKEDIKLLVRNIDGKLVKEVKEVIRIGENNYKVNLQSLAQGNYFIELIGQDWKIVSTLFIKMTY